MNKTKLHKILVYAARNVPYYKQLLQEYDIDELAESPEAFRTLPVLDKNTVLHDPGQFLSQEYLQYPGSAHLGIKRTSGSTGKYLKIYWDDYDDILSLMPLWMNRRKEYGIEPKDKMCFFYTTFYSKNKYIENPPLEMNIEGKSRGFSKIGLNPSRVIEIYERMLEFQPKYIIAQPSIMYLLAEAKKSQKLNRIESLRYIELTGEYLTEETRAFIADSFDVCICNQYGCNEANSIACECQHGNMHCIESGVYVEILDKDKSPVVDGQSGDIYITTLINKAMPFIRYGIGDRGRFVTKKCPCGNKNKSIEIENGRACDWITTAAGEKISSYLFYRSVETVNETLGSIILQFQICQEETDLFIVKLVIKESYMSWQEAIKDTFTECLSNTELNHMRWKFEFYTQLFPDDKTGKLSHFMNKTMQ